MHDQRPIRDVIDLTDPTCNTLFTMTLDEVRRRVAEGDPARVREIDGHFAIVARQGRTVRMARSLAVPMRYFMAKQADGPALIVAHRIDEIREWLRDHGLADQFHPTYTRMAPAHYVTRIDLVGCPDPSPTHTRYFSPVPGRMPADLDEIGRAYIGAVADEIAKWLRRLPDGAPIGVCFSGGIDSGAVFLLTHHILLKLGMNPARLKAFTLSVEAGGDDLAQARRFLEQVGLSLFHETIEAPASWIDCRAAIRLIEDYKPLDVQAGAMATALCRGVRERYPEWRYLVDGDGGDENLKDYPIEENPELTIHSVLNNRMLYHEGWGVDSLKHSPVYSGGLSRGCTRTFAPLRRYGFSGFSPFMSPNVIAVAEGIPFKELTGSSPDKLYRLKGEVVRRGVAAVAGASMPCFEKRRFQHGAAARGLFADRFPSTESAYRGAFRALFGD